MTVHIHYYMSCDRCNNQLIRSDGDHYGETEDEIKEIAERSGWTRETVPNGSEWFICKKCLEQMEGQSDDE